MLGRFLNAPLIFCEKILTVSEVYRFLFTWNQFFNFFFLWDQVTLQKKKKKFPKVKHTDQITLEKNRCRYSRKLLFLYIQKFLEKAPAK